VQNDCLNGALYRNNNDMECKYNISYMVVIVARSSAHIAEFIDID